MFKRLCLFLAISIPLQLSAQIRTVTGGRGPGIDYSPHQVLEKMAVVEFNSLIQSCLSDESRRSRFVNFIDIDVFVTTAKTTANLAVLDKNNICREFENQSEVLSCVQKVPDNFKTVILDFTRDYASAYNYLKNEHNLKDEEAQQLIENLRDIAGITPKLKKNENKR